MPFHLVPSELGGHYSIVLFKPRPYTMEPARWILEPRCVLTVRFSASRANFSSSFALHMHPRRAQSPTQLKSRLATDQTPHSFVSIPTSPLDRHDARALRTAVQVLRGTVPCVRCLGTFFLLPSADLLTYSPSSRLVPHLPMHMDHDLPFPVSTSSGTTTAMSTCSRDRTDVTPAGLDFQNFRAFAPHPFRRLLRSRTRPILASIRSCTYCTSRTRSYCTDVF